MKSIKINLLIVIIEFILLTLIFIYIMLLKNDNSIKTTYIILSVAFFYISDLFIYKKFKKISDDKLIKDGLVNSFAALGFIFSSCSDNDSYVKTLKIASRIILLLKTIDFVLLMIVISILVLN